MTSPSETPPHEVSFDCLSPIKWASGSRPFCGMQIYERTRRELEGEEPPEAWERKNDALRRLGLRTIPEKPTSRDGASG